jgi:cephalosporin hydroxylase
MARKNKLGGQNKLEWDEFIRRINKLKPESYLEIGAKFGIPLRYLIDRVPTLKRVGAVDWPDHGYSGRRGSAGRLKDILKNTVPHTIWLGDSKDKDIIKSVSEQEWDVIFIDADHSYEGVKADYENYAPLAKMLVGFHDIAHDIGHYNDGPRRLWDELKGSEKISHDGNSRGIGIIRKEE